MSWGAVAWATDSEIGSSKAKFILVLLANKADENFSCYPSVRTLMAESDASRSTVLRALKYLEARGFITRRAQFHDSGARRSTRYYLNHPRAPHFSPSPDPGLPRPDLTPPGFDPGRGPSRYATGTVSQRHPPAVSKRHPLNPSCESPSEPGDAAARIVHAVADVWKLGAREAHGLLPAVESALARGEPAADLIKRLTRTPTAPAIRCGYSPAASAKFHSTRIALQRPCRGAANVKTRILALSRSTCPTEARPHGFVHNAARKSTERVFFPSNLRFSERW